METPSPLCKFLQAATLGARRFIGIRFLPVCFVLFAASVLASETPVEVLDHESNSLFGTIIALDRTHIAIDVQGETQIIPLEKVVKIRNLAPSPYEGTPTMPPPEPAPAVRSRRNTDEQRFAKFLEEIKKSSQQAAKKTFPDSVASLELKDGSRWTASSFTVTKNQGTCRLLDQQNDLSLPLESINAVRFFVRNLLDVSNPPADWLRLAVPRVSGDQLIVGNPGSFDVYEGILHDINADTIFFSVDGEVLPVPRRKVFGFVLHGESPAKESETTARSSPLAILTLWTGTRSPISDIQMNGNELTWQTTAGLTVAVPISMVQEIDFGEKGVACLFDFERVRNEFSLPFDSDIPLEPLKLLQTFYERRTQASREIILDGIAYNRGITLHGKTVLEYHLSKPFAALKGIIGIEDQFRPHASATLQILANSQVLGTWELRGDGASQRIHLNLPQNCRLITIIAEPSPQTHVPAVLSIADPKLLE
jgi:hypothetical protein